MGVGVLLVCAGQCASPPQGVAPTQIAAPLELVVLPHGVAVTGVGASWRPGPWPHGPRSTVFLWRLLIIWGPHLESDARLLLGEVQAQPQICS